MEPKQVFWGYDRSATPASGGFIYCPSCGAELVMAARGEKKRPTCQRCGFVQYKSAAPAVSILIDDGGRVLLGKRLGELGQGKWALPSGYVEYEDDFLTTGIKEVKEETGLDVEIRALINVVSSFVAPDYHFLAIYLLARVIGGELAAADDLEEVAWFDLDGPLPELAFEEDASVIARYVRNGGAGLPVDPDYAKGDRMEP